MKKLLIILMCLGLVGCANPSYFRKNTQFTPVNWSTVAALPFTGDIRFTRESEDTLNSILLEQGNFKILDPSSIQYAIDKVMVGQDSSSSFTIVQAQKIGELVNADAILIGNVNSYNSGFMLNGFATIKVIDTKTRKIVAVSHKPSGLLMAFSEHQCAIKAVERSSKDILKLLNELSSKNRIIPLSENKTEQKTVPFGKDKHPI